MKQSRRNRRNAVARAERRAEGPPVQSKYARKVGKPIDVHTTPHAKGIDTNPEREHDA